MATGKELNQSFLKNIDELRENILRDGMNESKLSGNVVDVSGNNTAFVTNDDLDKFRAINALKNYLEFSTFKPEHTYEIYGAIIKEDGKEKATTLFIREEDITKVADMADEFEKLLGIKLPAQIHQAKTKYAKSVVPGTTSMAPRAKLMSESDKQYEEYLEQFYEDLNLPKEENVDGVGRKPYVHETIDYRTSDAVAPNYTSEYYLRRFAIDKAQSLAAAAANDRGAQNNRIEDGDRLTVRESDDVEKTPLGRKIGSALNSFDTFFKNQAMWKKIRIGAIGGIAGAGAICFAVSNPPVAVAALYGGALIGGTLYLSKKVGKWAQKKINDWLYGPELEKDRAPQNPENPEPQQTQQQTPPTPPTPPVPPVNSPVPPVNQPSSDAAAAGAPGAPSTPPTGGPGPDQQPPVQNPVVIPEQLDQFLAEAGINMEQYREIERRIAVAETELAGTMLNTQAYQIKAAELATLKKQLRDQLLVIEGLMDEMLKDFNIQKSGGRSL